MIERFWKFFKRHVLYNHDYPTFAEDKQACQEFFDNLDSHAKMLGIKPREIINLCNEQFRRL